MNIIHKKICMLGDFAVGKTSLVERFVYNRFDESYLSTIGVNIYRKEVDLSNSSRANLVIWDLAGDEKFYNVTTSYIQGSAGSLFVCDLSRRNTIDSIERYINRFRQIVPNAPFILIGNKCDLEFDSEAAAELNQLGLQYQIPVIATSAKTGKSVEQSFHILAQEMVK